MIALVGKVCIAFWFVDMGVSCSSPHHSVRDVADLETSSDNQHCVVQPSVPTAGCVPGPFHGERVMRSCPAASPQVVASLQCDIREASPPSVESESSPTVGLHLLAVRAAARNPIFQHHDDGDDDVASVHPPPPPVGLLGVHGGFSLNAILQETAEKERAERRMRHEHPFGNHRDKLQQGTVDTLQSAEWNV